MCGVALISIAFINLYALCLFPDYVQQPAISEDQKRNAMNNATKTAATAYINSQMPPAQLQQEQQPGFTQV